MNGTRHIGTYRLPTYLYIFDFPILGSMNCGHSKVEPRIDWPIATFSRSFPQPTKVNPSPQYSFTIGHRRNVFYPYVNFLINSDLPAKQDSLIMLGT